MTYAKHLVSGRQTPQSSPIPGREHQMAPNEAGGFSFVVDDWTRLDRFLILGAEGGSYYVGERELTIQNAEAVQRCLADDPMRVIERTVVVSEAGLAPKNDPAVFVLALAASVKGTAEKVRDARHRALTVLPKVARIGTDLFNFVSACDKLRGWGRGLRTGIRNWYLSKDASSVAYQCSKYQSRNGWSHKDLLRLSHPQATGTMQDVLHYVAKGWPDVGDEPHPNKDLQLLWAFERAHKATTPGEVAKLIRDYGLVREHIPTEMLNSVEVWEALLEKMPLRALIRNLGKMSAIGLIQPGVSAGTAQVLKLIGNTEAIKKSRLHPMAILIAVRQYALGHGLKGKLTWTAAPRVIDALNATFYVAFGNVKPTGKRRLEAIDASGSMDAQIDGAGNLSCRHAGVVMALITLNADPDTEVIGFTCGGDVKSVPISPRQRLDDAIRTFDAHCRPAGTDCALPFIYAKEMRRDLDLIGLYSDSETWENTKTHPVQSFESYRQQVGHRVKLAVVSMVANRSTVGDIDDGDVLQVCGMDASVPAVLSSFAGQTVEADESE
jgi:60 kDa SS-A/Ro ribonucleoprotein